jgi:hypothetical protein
MKNYSPNRANRLAGVLAKYLNTYTDNDDEKSFEYILADLRHLAVARGVDFKAANKRAKKAFKASVKAIEALQSDSTATKRRQTNEQQEPRPGQQSL